MYYCENCYSVFDAPKIVYESHGFSRPPFEEFEACPLCDTPGMFRSCNEDESEEE